MGRHYTHICTTPYMPGRGVAPFYYSSYQQPMNEGYTCPDKHMFVSSRSSPDVATCAMQRLATRQFEIICKSLKLRTGLVERTPIKINVSRMLDVWGRCRRDSMCTGVYFWINSADNEIYADAFYCHELSLSLSLCKADCSVLLNFEAGQVQPVTRACQIFYYTTSKKFELWDPITLRFTV